MLLTCPNCETSYEIPDGAVGPQGRQVQCSSCSHVWFQSGGEAETPAVEATPTFVSSRQDDKPEFDRELAQELAREPELAQEMEHPDPMTEQASSTSIPAPGLVETGVSQESFSQSSSHSESSSDLVEKFFEAQAAQEKAESTVSADDATEAVSEELLVESAPPESPEVSVLDTEASVDLQPAEIQSGQPNLSKITGHDALETAAKDLSDEVSQYTADTADEANAITRTLEETVTATHEGTISDTADALDDASQSLVDDVSGAEQELAPKLDEAVDPVTQFENALNESDLPQDDNGGPANQDTHEDDSAWGALGARAAATAATAAAVGTSPRLKSYSDLLGDTTTRARDLTELDNEALTRSLRDQISQAEDEEEDQDDVRTRLEPAQRRTNLPDANELNSSLREVREERKRNEPIRSGFLTGFMIALLLGFLAVALYIFAPQLSIAVPTLEEPLKSYVAFCDDVRDSVAGLFGSS